MANDRIAERQTGAPGSAGATAATRAAPRAAGPRRRGSSDGRRSDENLLTRERPRSRGNNQTMIIGGSIVVIGVIALIVLLNSGGRAIDATTEPGSNVPVVVVLTTSGGALTSDQKPVATGTKIPAGQGLDNIRGETTVQLAGSARVVLHAGSRVTSFDALPDRTGQVLLAKGTLEIQVGVHPGVEVRTAHGRVTFGIGRGTVSCESDRTLVHTHSGSITVAGANGIGATQLPPDQRMEILSGAAPRLLQPAAFVRGVNLGGGPVTIDRRRWLSHREALSAGFALGDLTSIAPPSMFSGSGLDFDRKTMLDTGLIGTGAPVQFSQILPEGSYSLTLWLANTANLQADRLALTVNDQAVPVNGALLKRDTWAQLGPLPIRATKGRIEVSFAGQGNARIAGFALEAPGGDKLALPSAVAITGPADGTSFYAGDPVTIRAEVFGAVKAVRFFSGDSLIGEATRDPYLVNIPKLAPGEQRIVARAINLNGDISESLPLALSVIPSFGSGTILVERWTGIKGPYLDDVNGKVKINQPPQMKIEPKEFATQIDWGDNYYCRIRGYVHPPITGDYVFWMTNDDEGELLLSTSDDPAQAKRIAHNRSAVAPREWTKEDTQQSRSIPLIAGQKYYVELRYKENEGGDHGAVGWKLPNGMLERPIPGAHLSPFKP